ncbi:glutathione S-transferase family protein [Ramlibacter sp. G-1-2-2]|uniref:Glutathione S-transferase family protein n=1 Tax=Ramlibacter agri TaxID=2728837 RepID=A0A848H7J8_9BURK|nr:glutathione S-transferase family protein [Ramlibacter agri]NML46976.1 glutathione S-transferase family protein [Ramlibacter agri]
MLKLYYAPGTCALASHIALEYAGAPYEAVRLDFKAQQQRSPEYLKINPKGRVPALVTDRGALTETPALLLYIAQAWPAAQLAPLDDPFALAKMNEFNSYLCSTVHPYHAHGARGSRWSDDAAAIESMKKKVPQTMGESFTLIEEQFFKGPWVLGERMSTCDLYLYTIARWLKGDGVDPARFPRVADMAARLEQQPQVQKVLAAQQAG